MTPGEIQVEVSANGCVVGIYDAVDAQGARDACAVDAGYESEAEMVALIGYPSDLVANEVQTWEAWLDGERDQSVLFTVYPNEEVVEAGASALNVRVTESLNVLRVSRRAQS